MVPNGLSSEGEGLKLISIQFLREEYVNSDAIAMDSQID